MEALSSQETTWSRQGAMSPSYIWRSFILTPEKKNYSEISHRLEQVLQGLGRIHIAESLSYDWTAC